MSKEKYDIRNLTEIHTKFGTLYRENLETSMVDGAEMLNSGFVNMVGKYYILING